MRTAFTTLTGRMIQIDSHRTIGDGNLGAKSARLRLWQLQIEAIGRPSTDGIEQGLVYFPHLSMTPSLWAGFLGRAGASHENPESAEAINRTEFDAHEKETLRDARETFNGLEIAVRSDECTAAGVGLWHTGIMNVKARDDPQVQMRMETIVKQILASEFSRDVQAFKRRTGLPVEETPGVLVMPLAGKRLDYVMPSAFGPVFHANAITGFHPYGTLISVGVGLGGANNTSAITQILKILRSVHLTSRMLSTNTLHARFFHGGEVKQTKGIEDMEYYLDMIIDSYGDGMDILLKGLNEDLERLPPGLYLELALDGEAWAVLQAAEISLKEVTPPEIEESRIILNAEADRGETAQFGTHVSGRADMETDMVVYLDSLSNANIARLQKINDEMSRGYTLIINDSPRLIGKMLSFADYSNAAAIISDSMKVRHGTGTHFNGALREAGIVLLVGNVDGAFKNGLKNGQAIEKKLRVYANDAEEEGWVATA